MKGNWIFLALVALCGCSLFLDIHWGLTLFFHLVWLRIFLLRKRYIIYSAMFIYVIFALIGFWTNENHFTKLSANQSLFLISFSDYPQIDGNQLKSVVTTNKNEKVMLNYIIQTEEEQKKLIDHLSIGQSCKVVGELVRPEENRNENLFNYRRYLFRQNIHWILKMKTFIACNEPKKGGLAFIYHIREEGLKKIDYVFSKATTPYAKALLFGDSNSFTEEIYSLYQRLGIVHLLAISGLHVGVISGGIFYFFIRIGLTREASSKMLFIILPLYSLFTGANPPVVRAVMMTMLLIISIQKKSPFTSLDALSISFLFLLFKNPYLLFNIGFQLSFTVSLAILLASRSILPRYHHFLTKTFMVSFISQVAAIPILTFNFFEFSIISLFSNILYVPLYTFIILPLLFFAYLMFYTTPMNFSFFEYISQWIILFSEKLGHILDIKGGVIVLGKPKIIILLVLIITTQGLFILLEKGYSILISATPLMVLICLIKIFQFVSPIGEVTAIDVGQGDSILIQLPYHQGTYLIDTGGQIVIQQDEWKRRRKNFQIGNDIIIPLLKSKGITVIDKLILTHSDADHIGEANEIINKLSIKQVLVPPNSWEKPLMMDILTKAKNSKIPIKVVKNGVKWLNPSGSFQFVSPFDNNYDGNNGSLVLYANVGGKSWLFTGDLEEKGEQKLIAQHKFKIDVLKVGHHGSKSSSSENFIEQLNPKFAIISAGRNNRYGHPNHEVLKILEEHHIHIFRTDQNGAIQYKFYKNKGTFHTIFP